MNRRNIMITDKQEDKIKEESVKKGISFSEMLRIIIDKFFERKRIGGED